MWNLTECQTDRHLSRHFKQPCQSLDLTLEGEVSEFLEGVLVGFCFSKIQRKNASHLVNALRSRLTARSGEWDASRVTTQFVARLRQFFSLFTLFLSLPKGENQSH